MKKDQILSILIDSKEINLNEYLVYCYGSILLILIYMSKFEYDDIFSLLDHEFNTENVLLGIITLLLTLPFEILASQTIWFIHQKRNFNIKFLFSERQINVN